MLSGPPRPGQHTPQLAPVVLSQSILALETMLSIAGCRLGKTLLSRGSMERNGGLVGSFSRTKSSVRVSCLMRPLRFRVGVSWKFPCVPTAYTCGAIADCSFPLLYALGLQRASVDWRIFGATSSFAVKIEHSHRLSQLHKTQPPSVSNPFALPFSYFFQGCIGLQSGCKRVPNHITGDSSRPTASPSQMTRRTAC
jgi:hypothetical protein